MSHDLRHDEETRAVALKPMLTDPQVKTIRRRFNKGEQLTALAVAYGVNRKTLRRRIDAREHAEADHTERIAANRRRKKSAAEQRQPKATLAATWSQNNDPRQSAPGQPAKTPASHDRRAA